MGYIYKTSLDLYTVFSLQFFSRVLSPPRFKINCVTTDRTARIIFNDEWVILERGAGPRLRLRADDLRRYSSLFFSLPLSVKVNTAEWVEQFTHLGPFEGQHGWDLVGPGMDLLKYLLRDSVIRTQDGNI